MLNEVYMYNIVRGLRHIILSKDFEGDVYDVVDEIIKNNPEPAVEKFAKRFLIDYNNYIRKDPDRKNPENFAAPSLKDLTQQELDAGYDAFRNYISNAVSPIDTDAIVDLVVKRIARFPKIKIEAAIEETDYAYGHRTAGRLVVLIARGVLHESGKIDIADAKEEFKAYALSLPDAASFQDDFLNGFEEVLKYFENFAQQASDDETHEKYAQILIDTFKGVDERLIDAMGKIPDAYGMKSIAEWAASGKFSAAVLGQKLRLIGSVKHTKKSINDLLKIWAARYDDIKAYATGEPSDEQKVVIVKLIELTRKIVEAIEYSDNTDLGALPWQIQNLLRGIARNDPKVSDDSIKTIQNLLLELSLTQPPSYAITLEHVENAIKLLEKAGKNISLAKDPDFQETMGDIYNTLRTARRAGFVPYDVSDKVKEKYGLNGSKGFFAMLEDMIMEMDTAPSFKNFTNALKNDSAEGKHDRRNALNFLLRLANKWSAATESEHQKFVIGFADMIESYLKKAAAEEKKLRAENPPEVKKSAKYRPLDDYAFADDRAGQVPPEPDNAEEVKLYTALRKHYVQNIPLTKEYASQIEKIMSKGIYKKIFHEPTATWLFRGMGASEKYLRKILKLKEGESIPKSGSKTASFTYTPRGGVGASSWSVSTGTAENFKDTDQPYRIIMQASRARNPNKFVEGPGGLYKVKGFSSYADEEESLALGDIKVTKIYWSPPHGTIPASAGLPKDKPKPDDIKWNKTKSKTKKPAAKKTATTTKSKAKKPAVKAPAKKKATKK